jgi:hypothetical protein
MSVAITIPAATTRTGAGVVTITWVPRPAAVRTVVLRPVATGQVAVAPHQGVLAMAEVAVVPRRRFPVVRVDARIPRIDECW